MYIEFIVIVTVPLRHAQDQASKNPIMNGKGVQEVPSLSGELLVVGVYWRRDNQFSNGYSL